jgi:hypothetical protein
MRRITRRWFYRWLELAHECELCGDIDDISVHGALSTGEVVCWHCAERTGEFTIPPEREWRHSSIG